MTTPRALRDDLSNALDFLRTAELVTYTTVVAFQESWVSWHSYGRTPFMTERGPSTPAQYLGWVTGGHYSAALPDASLLQLTYEFRLGVLTAHRLAYVPCPVDVDQQLLREGFPIADVVELGLDSPLGSASALRSPIRFDFDVSGAREGHPAAHLTVNAAQCRIACVAPLHPYRFIDFVYRHFYPDLWNAQKAWFAEGADRWLGDDVISEDERASLHVAWRRHRL